MSRPQSRYVRVDPTNPEGAAQCDRCGHWVPLRTLVNQMQWAGTRLYPTGVMVCTSPGNNCLDVPQEQFRTIILPPDPPPLLNARVPNFDYEEQTVRITQFADAFGPPWAAGPQMIRCTEDGKQERVIQYLTQSAPGAAPVGVDGFFTLGRSELGGPDVLFGPPTQRVNPTPFKTGKSKAGGPDVVG